MLDLLLYVKIITNSNLMYKIPYIFLPFFFYLNY